MKITTLDNLYLHLLQDMYSCEKQTIKALPKLAKAAKHKKLQKALLDHLEESKEHLERLDQILEDLGKSPGRKVCEATVGLVKESLDMIEADADDEVRDVGLICAAQRIEHYEIAMYGCLRTFANLIDRRADIKLLDKSLNDEKGSDVALTVLAMGAVNDKAKSPASANAEKIGAAAR